MYIHNIHFSFNHVLFRKAIISDIRQLCFKTSIVVLGMIDWIDWIDWKFRDINNITEHILDLKIPSIKKSSIFIQLTPLIGAFLWPITSSTYET